MTYKGFVDNKPVTIQGETWIDAMHNAGYEIETQIRSGNSFCGLLKSGETLLNLTHERREEEQI